MSKLQSEIAAERIAERYGASAAREGKSYDDNPYHPSQAALRLAWSRGHNGERAAWGNCMSPSQRIAYKALVISPVRNMSTTEEETDMTVCIAADAQIWTVYGVTEGGTSEALHDEEHAEDAATALLRFSEALGNLPVIFACAEHRVPEGPFAELTDRLAEIIHDEIPGYDDPEDFRDDDFDNHPLAALREAVVELTQG